MYTYMYTYMYINISECIYIYKHAHTYTHTHTHIYLCIHIIPGQSTSLPRREPRPQVSALRQTIYLSIYM